MIENERKRQEIQNYKERELLYEIEIKELKNLSLYNN
jgi:hypothetical protein